MKRSSVFFPCVILGSGSYKFCAESFLFSLVNPSGSEPTKMSLTGSNNEYGIYCSSECGPTFGGSPDLRIGNRPNERYNDNATSLGHAYQCPRVKKNNSFLVGNSEFSVNEVEVFVLKAN